MPRKANMVPRTKVLKIDKDCVVNAEWVRNYVRLIRSVCEWFKVEVKSIKRCLSQRKGEHYLIEITPSVPATLANRLQWLAGDDSQRVDFNRARIESGLTEWNKLFERPNAKLQTIYPRIKRPTRRRPTSKRR